MAADLDQLARAAGDFGAAATPEKLRCLRKVASSKIRSGRRLRTLHDVVCFLQAYPDDARVLTATRDIAKGMRQRFIDEGVDTEAASFEATGAPGSVVVNEFSYPVLRRLNGQYPDCLEIDWDSFDDQERLVNALALFTTSLECQGLDDIEIPLEEWFSACRDDERGTDLAVLLDLFDSDALDPAARDILWESCAVPVRFTLGAEGTARCELRWPVERVYFQRRALDRKLPNVRSTVRRPFADVRHLGRRDGEAMIMLALRTLCARGLEIRTLSYANSDDVSLVECGRGLMVAIIGVVPSYRDPLECHHCCLILKNGIPIAYGPGTVSLGCCEIGLNLFPEFRGAEVRFLYPQFMRALHQVLGAELFFLTAYGMGKGNPAAIRTGAFWFYRKLGFRPDNPTVHQLAKAEEARMAREPGYRSGTAVLRRLSDTSVRLDLSGSMCSPLDLGRIGLLQTRYVNERFGGDRRRAIAACIRKIARAVGIEVRAIAAPERRAWEMLAPLLAMINDLDAWSARSRRGLARIIRAKAARREAPVDRLIRAHGPLCEALRAL